MSTSLRLLGAEVANKFHLLCQLQIDCLERQSEAMFDITGKDFYVRLAMCSCMEKITLRLNA